jgi:N-acetyl sugar amidotransferase
MIKCKKCLYPETYETITFDKKGICNICDQTTVQKEKINWKKRHKEFNKIINFYRNKYDYDCIVPFSGGKDSTFQLYYLIKVKKLKPLVVRFNHSFFRVQTLKNTENVLKKLGCDFIDFTPNWKIVKLLMKESFKRKGDFCWHCHTGIYSYPIQLAVKFNIPLVVYGEPLAEMSAYYSYKEIESEDQEKFDMVRNLGISADDMFNMLVGSNNKIDKRDLLPYSYPAKGLVEKMKIKSINLGNYIKWDYNEQTKIIKQKLGWESDELEGVPEKANPFSSKIECYMQGSRDYIKYIKRGYGRITQNMANEIRKKNISLIEAKKLIKFEGKKPPSLEIFLKYVGLSEKEFFNTLKPMQVYPNKYNFDKIEVAKKTKDFESWYNEK